MKAKYLLLLLLFGSLLAVSPLFGAAQTIAVVVNVGNQNDSLSAEAINDMYRGTTQQWPSGEKVVPVNLDPASDIYAAFYGQVLDAEPGQQFTLRGSPKPFRTSTRRSSRSILRFVGRFEGAIGYLPVDEVDDSVKVVYTFDFETSNPEAMPAVEQ